MCGVAGTIGIHPDVAVPARPECSPCMPRSGWWGIEVIEVPVYQSFSCMLGSRSSTYRRPTGSRCLCGLRRMHPNLRITYNREVYDFQELRDALVPHGLIPKSGNDTEVMMLAYRQWGEEAVERFRGMFAFALADPARGRIWLARDRLGIKPLYCSAPTRVDFSSRLKFALLAAGPDLVPRRLSTRALESFLAGALRLWG